MEGNLAKPSEWKNPIWRNVPKEVVASFISGFEAHPLNFVFQPEQLAELVAPTTEERLQLSEYIVLPQGSANERLSFGGVEVRPSLRRLVVRSAISSILVSGSKARVGSRGMSGRGWTWPSTGQFRRRA